MNPVTLRELRQKYGVSVGEMAKRLKLTDANILLLESIDLRLFDVQALKDYLEALGLSLECRVVFPDGASQPLSW